MWQQFTGIGNLAADPEIKFTQSGTAVANFTVCCDSGYGEHKKTEFVRCVAWGKLAEEVIGKYFFKGQKCMIQGTMETRKWEKDGVTRFTTEIRVETAKNLSPRSDSGSTRDEPPQQGPFGGGMESDVPF